MSMSIPYVETGRTRQKARTRQALIDAARELLDHGSAPAVEEAAEVAGVSRATAYRYFPNRHALVAAAYPEITVQTLLPEDAPPDAAARLDIVIRFMGRMIVDSEAAYRAMLRMSLEEDVRREDLVLRRGRGIAWLEDALAPAKRAMAEGDFHRLVLAIRSASGIEAFVWLTDVAGLSRRKALDVMAWSARALLAATLDGFGSPEPDGAARRRASRSA
jgi:AcrR family transcriptional regulator